MIDHIYLPVSDLKRSSEFYKKVLEPLGIDCPTSSIDFSVSPSMASRVSG
jgi:predicted lactoylglutathione lyase